MQELEDLYLPYKQKKKTRASVARAKGLEPLALAILLGQSKDTPRELAKNYLNDEVENIEQALQGAADIIAETAAEDAEMRKVIRAISYHEGIMQSKAADPEAISPYQMYYELC